MNRIFIVGGDGLAREVYSYIDRMMQAGEKIQFGGFLGHNGYDNPENYKEYKELYVCDVDGFVFEENDCAVIGVAKPAIRKSIYTYLKNRGVKMPNIIDPSCILFPHSELGDGNILAIRTLISTNVHIGNGNLFNGGVEVGHDAIIGDFNFISPNVRVLGNVKVGSENIIATSSVLLPKSRIGNENTIVPVSVVYKGCGNNCYMSGNPAVKVNN
ncbi:transferase [Candidatus Symbiopectobacterium sp. 'North America']|uniref:hypothetical protein n=1 Tax=Candidatus Symbiopectobacterium sp. 'North America' TaxID=2794574 RepID=UPI0018C91BA2|nr:hypothetical protein [Candidatus Symbiopectobacterium sp. 'North America']MBG6245352.1 transferase [Candidatus Symbiopectobacterium sp. 'North America']